MIETENEFSSDDSCVTVTKDTGGVRFTTSGQLGVQIVADTTGGASHASIYGDPAGLLALADLLTAFAKLDQDLIQDRNCPIGEGVHTTLDGNHGLVSDSIRLHIGRMDAKGDGDRDWFNRQAPVKIVCPPGDRD